MRNYVVINGVSSLTIPGLAIKDLPSISKPLMRNQKEEVDGRDGDIITELGYSAYDKTLQIGLFGTYDINQIIAFFNQKGTIVFSDEDDKYYDFTILDQIDYEKLVKFRTASVRIHCQPFKYPVSETPVVVQPESVSGEGTDITLNNTGVASLEIGLKGNTSQEGTPTPDTPQEVQVVTGDNTIKVCNKNLVNINIIGQVPSISNGELTNYSGAGCTELIEIDNTKSYYFTFDMSAQRYVFFYDNNKNFLGYISSVNYGYDLKTNANFINTKYVRVRVDAIVDVNWIQLEKNNQATPYTPHQSQEYEINLGTLELCKIGTYQDYLYKSGENWYKHTEIGKYIANNDLTNNGAITTTIPMLTPSISALGNSVDLLSNLMLEAGSGDTRLAGTTSSGKVRVYLSTTYASTMEEANTYLTNNNFTIYFPLATPTEEQITNAELIEQLEAILNAVSYEDQTNITQDNDNLPFILDVSALKKGTDETVINNIGNIYAKPVIALVGNGTIGLYLNNVQLLSIDMSTYNEITIDTNNMEAYDPNTSQLRNRQVIGDYSSLKLQPGNNTLSFSGDLTSATITNWKRWL